jgi:SPOR domain
MSEGVIEQATSPKRRRTAIATREKIFIGGLGALTPILVNLLVVDLELVFSKLTTLVFLGYALRVLFLFYLGGLYAYLHKKENDAVRIFELGIVAPALIISIVNGTNAIRVDLRATPVNRQAVTESAGAPAWSDDVSPAAFIVAMQQDSASADPTVKPEGSSGPLLKTFSPPQESTSEQILRGLLGSQSPRVWFVVVGSYSSLDNAVAHAGRINRRWKGYSAEVYAPYDTPYYAVVVGANLTLNEAYRLRAKITRLRLTRDVYIKRGPDPT